MGKEWLVNRADRAHTHIAISLPHSTPPTIIIKTSKYHHNRYNSEKFELLKYNTYLK